jgi:hypothetical protein
MTTKPLAQSATDTDLKNALSALETSLATPLVSGELSDWLDNAKQTWAKASAQIQDCIEHGHPTQLEQIGNADPELLPRVEQLQAEDAAIEQDRQAFDQAVSRVAVHAPKLEPDEEKAQQHVKKLVDEGMALLARVRKQEVAIQTWFVEAFNRDRGAGD